MEPGEEIFENTFAPACANRRLTVYEIIEGMKFGAFDYRVLPAKVRKAVDKALKYNDALEAKRKRENYYEDMWELDLLDIGLGHASNGTEKSPYSKPATRAHTKTLAKNMSMSNNNVNALFLYNWSRAMGDPVVHQSVRVLPETMTYKIMGMELET